MAKNLELISDYYKYEFYPINSIDFTFFSLTCLYEIRHLSYAEYFFIYYRILFNFSSKLLSISFFNINYTKFSICNTNGRFF